MNAASHTIESLRTPVGDAEVRALAMLLVDAVESGAAVSFLQPISQERAEQWWRQTLGSANAIVLVARAGDDIVGTVQIQRAWAPNQPHRGEVVKMIVRRDHQGAGLGARMMQAVEDAGRAAGLTLLTLDAKRGGAADRLYRRMGWTFVGIIPDFAIDPDGQALHDTVIFYKRLDAARSEPST